MILSWGLEFHMPEWELYRFVKLLLLYSWYWNIIINDFFFYSCYFYWILPSPGSGYYKFGFPLLWFSPGVGTLCYMGQAWPFTCFTNYSFIEPQPQPPFSYLPWLFCAALTDLNSCNRDLIAHKAGQVCHLDLYRKSWLTLSRIHTTFPISQ